jgi:multidrug efflux pump subunit AcrB
VTRNLSMADLASAISAGTSYAGAGQFDGKTRSYVLRPNGQLDTAEGYRNLIIDRGSDSAPVCANVAKVTECAGRASLASLFRARL